MSYTLTDIAQFIMFGAIKNKKELDEKIQGQWEFRKDKTIDDLNHAVKKGMKHGNGKTENEIEWVALYLKDIFKAVKK